MNDSQDCRGAKPLRKSVRGQPVPTAARMMTVMRMKGLSDKARLVLAVLANHDGAGGCYPSRALIAFEASMSPRSVDRALAECRSRGVLNSRQRRGSNVYKIDYEWTAEGRQTAPTAGEVKPGKPCQRMADIPCQQLANEPESNHLRREDISGLSAREISSLHPSRTRCKDSTCDPVRASPGSARDVTAFPETEGKSPNTRADSQVNGVDIHERASALKALRHKGRDQLTVTERLLLNRECAEAWRKRGDPAKAALFDEAADKLEGEGGVGHVSIRCIETA